MLSIDTNILFAAIEPTNANHPRARAFLESVEARDDVAISELALLELYVLLRNPVVLERPLGAGAAARVCQAFRCHPRWQVVGFPPDSRAFHDAFWPRLANEGLARRRAYDWRMALCLQSHGVDELATVNTRDFEGVGFRRVWNPLAAS